MAVVLETRNELLRLGGIGGTYTVRTAAGERAIRLQPGVLEFEDIPVGADVHARIDWPHGLISAAEILAPTQVVAAAGRTLTFVAGPPGTITASTGSFIADGFRVGMLVTVSGTVSNDGTYPVTSVTALVLTVGALLVAEGPLAAGQTLDGSTTRAQPYRFELAPLPDPSLQLGLPAGSLRTQRRIITSPGGGPAGSGPPGKFQTVPTYVAFSVAQDGALVESGKAQHTLSMPGQPGATPDLAPRERNLLRLRWVGQAVSGATLAAVVAATTVENIIWGAAAHRRLVPGSIRLTLPTSTLHLRDNGKGRLVTESGEAFAGDGVVDYESGAYRLTMGAAETGNILADYEHDCAYDPLDLSLSWDSLASQ